MPLSPTLAPLETVRSAGSRRIRLDDGAETTVHVAVHDLARTELRVVVLDPVERLATWCRDAGVEEALVGGFFVRQGALPLGEVRCAGAPIPSVPFDAPWHRLRSCIHAGASAVTLATRADLPAEPGGDLLQAGPLLVSEGETLIRLGEDPEGFSAGRRQFDSDITAGRYPRAALGVGSRSAWAVVCDGRADSEAGLTLGELAALMRALGARAAINLDGGGSASLVSGGRLVNRPREEHGVVLLEGRPISTALAFLPRG